MNLQPIKVSDIPSISIFVRHSLNCPRKRDELYRNCRCPKHLRYTHDGKQHVFNVEMALIKDIAMKTIMGGEPVWFGCDVGKMMRKDMGLWDRNLYNFETLYDTTFNLDKSQRLQYHQTQMTHAMLFTGVDVVHDRPRRWRVENSWGEESSGRKGFYVMNDSWFDEHMFEIAANKKYLSAELLKALEAEPIVLPAWDPMGALAR